MQDYEDSTLREECDYALCTECHSLIKPYHNTSIMTITQQIHRSRPHSNNDTDNAVEIGKQTLASTHPFTLSLLRHHHVHCAKCGLYIEIHPQLDDDHSQKIFVCSHTPPHRYALCYHCGLLYGINPMQKSIDIINILHSQLDSIELEKKAKESMPNTAPTAIATAESEQSNLLKIASNESIKACKVNLIAKAEEEEDEDAQEKEEEVDEDLEEEEEHSTEIKEVNDISDAVESSDGDDSCSVRPALDGSTATKSAGPSGVHMESFLTLRERLPAIHHSNKTASCPTSPNANRSHSSSSSLRDGKGDRDGDREGDKEKTAGSKFSTLPHSLRGSPLLGPSTPSPRVLSRDVDETDKKWHDYLHRKEEKKATIHSRRSNSKSKLEETQSQIEQLQLLLKQASSNKSSSKEFADIFRRGAYSSKVTLKLSQTVNNTEK